MDSTEVTLGTNEGANEEMRHLSDTNRVSRLFFFFLLILWAQITILIIHEFFRMTLSQINAGSILVIDFY